MSDTQDLFDDQSVDDATTTAYATPPSERPRKVDPARETMAERVRSYEDGRRSGCIEALGYAMAAAVHAGDDVVAAKIAAFASGRGWTADFQTELKRRGVQW